jgi:hypothetical protein
MQSKTQIMIIAILTTAMFSATLVMSLTVQLAAAVCSPKNPNVCANNFSGSTNAGVPKNFVRAIKSGSLTEAHFYPLSPDKRGAVSTTTLSTCPSHGPATVQNGKITCAA